MSAAFLQLRTEPIERKATLSFHRFSDLAALQSDPNWLWEGLLAPGTVTMLAGDSFVGKTTLVARLLKAMESGSPFLGRKTRRATALLLTEEHPVTLRQKSEQLDLLTLGSEFLSRADGVFGLEWQALIEQATEYALEQGHELLVIDTFSGLAGLRSEEENDAGAITERLRPLQVAAGEGLAVFFLHHVNKQGGTRGSSAFSGQADATIRMERKKRRTDFRLLIESRCAPPHALRGKLSRTSDGLDYVVLDDEGAPSEPRVRTLSSDERLLQILRDAYPVGVTYEEIDAIDGLSRDLAKKRFPGWYRERKINRYGRGTKCNPFRWYAKPAS